MKYRVRVESFVCVDASNQQAAKAIAEQAVRQAVSVAYRADGDGIRPRFADRWELFAFQAKKAERVSEDE